ncbi:IclR family transcriptional regulator [Lysinimonas soli]|uniref:IclR family transcriptional regulator n=1 Tax=Lysinimonas soli TaxID=1074233 RepID=A0ABW0NQ09_9MICO
MNESREPVILQTLLRGLAVLNIVARGEGEATARQIATELELHQATCYHLLRTLVSEEYITRTPNGKYDVGPRGGALGYHLERQFGPRAELSAILTRLHTQTHETAYVAGWRNGTMVIQQFLSGSGPIAVGNLDVGYGANLHARASCLSVLAYLPQELVEVMLQGTRFEKLTANTIGSFDELLVRLEQVRRTGYAIDDEEFSDGVCCVSAPFFDADGQPLGSFTVSAATSRFAAQAGTLANAVLEAAALATQLGGGTGRRLPVTRKAGAS